MPHHRMADRAQLLDQRAGRHDVAEPQRGREALGHRAHVDHAAGLVEALERRHRRAFVEVLGLVVVFDDDEVLQLGLAQQTLPALEAQRGGGRALVRGRDEQVVDRRQRIDDQAFGVDRDLHPPRPAQREAVARVRVAGLLQADALRPVEQRIGEQVVRVLRTDRDDDLGPVREHAALGQEARPDLLDQLGHVVGVEIGRPVRQLRAREAARAAFAEVFGREQLRVVGAIDERVRVVTPPVGLGERRPADQRAQHAPVPGRCGARRAAGAGQRIGERGRQRLRVLRDEHTAARPRFEKALVRQLQVGRGHRGAAHAEHGSELARRRQRRAGAEPAIEDRLHHGEAQAPLQWERRLRGQLEQRRPLDGGARGGHALARV